MSLLKDYSKRISTAKKYINTLTPNKKERKSYLKIWALSGMPLIQQGGIQPSYNAKTKVLKVPKVNETNPNNLELLNYKFSNNYNHKDFFLHELGHAKTDKATKSGSVNRLKMHAGYKPLERGGTLLMGLLGGKTTTALALYNSMLNRKHGTHPLIHTDLYAYPKRTPSEVHQEMGGNRNYFIQEENFVDKRKSGKESVQYMLENQLNILQDPKYNKNYLSKIAGNIKLLSENYKDTKKIRKKVKENYLESLGVPELIKMNKLKKPYNLAEQMKSRDEEIDYSDRLYDVGIDSDIY